MDYANSFQKLITIVKDQAGEQGLKKGMEQLDSISGKTFRVPIELFTDDEKSLQIIKDFELDDPEIMMRFMIESFYGALEAVQSDILSVKGMQVGEFISLVKSAKNMYAYGVDNPDAKAEKFGTAQNDLFRAVGILSGQIEACIAEIRAKDNLSPWKFFVNAKGHMATVDADIALIRQALDAMEQAVSVQMLIAKELNAKIETAVFKPYEEFYDTVLLAGDTPTLLDSYEFKDKKSEKYFLRLAEKRGRVRMLDVAYEEYVDELESYDTIIF